MVAQKISTIVRPIVISVLLLFITATLTQYLFSLFIPSFNILASKDLGKVVFTLLVFVSLGSFVWQQPKLFQQQWLERNVYFLSSRQGLTIFTRYFLVFFVLHTLFLLTCYFCGVGFFQASLMSNGWKISGKIIFGFFVTFLLALTEEIMFRGTFYPYFVQFVRPLGAVTLTSLFFMTVHFLPNPLLQLWQNLPTAIGLFLLGFMLNLIFISTKSMYANIGTHAGLVFVKVILRKITFFNFAPALPWFLHSDLRQAPLVHLLFAGISISLIIKLTFRTPVN